MAAMQIPKTMTVQDVIRRLTRSNGAEVKGVRAEYSELRKIANKRIKRAQAKGELMDVEQFRTTTSIMKGDDALKNLARSYAAVIKFLNSEASTAKGRETIQRRRLKTLQSLNYTGVTEENMKLFQDFMEQWRIAYQLNTTMGKKLLSDSDLAAEFFDTWFERIKKNDENTNGAKIMRIFKKWQKRLGV